MNPPTTIPPVPSSVLEFHSTDGRQPPAEFASNDNLARHGSQAGPSHQPGPQFTPDGRYASRPHTATCPHGYPTPPSRSIPLTPSAHRDTQSQPQRPPSSPGAPDGRPTARTPVPSAYPTPPPRPTALPPRPLSYLPTAVPQAMSHPTMSHPNMSHPNNGASGPHLHRPPHASASRPPQASASRPPPAQHPPFPPPNVPTNYRTAPSAPSSSQQPPPTHSRPPPTPPHGALPPTPVPAASPSQLPIPRVSAPPRAPPMSASTSYGNPNPPGASSSSQHAARPPHAAVLPQLQPYKPLSDVLEGAWADHTHRLEARVALLEPALHYAQTECARLDAQGQQVLANARAAVGHLQDELRRLQSGQAGENARLGAENARLRGEWDRLRAERDGLRVERDAAQEDSARAGFALQAALEEHAAARAEDQRLLQVARQEYKALQTKAWAFGRATQLRLQAVAQERDEWKARAAGDVKEEPSAGEIIPDENQPDPDSGLTPKSEPMDDLLELELQYPPEPEPSTSALPPGSSSLAAPSSSPADTCASPSTFYTWEPPPQTDRKRSRAEYEADGAAAEDEVRMRRRVRSSSPSLGPAFPLPTPMAAFPVPMVMAQAVDVKGLNSPLKWMMEIRRKGGG